MNLGKGVDEKVKYMCIYGSDGTKSAYNAGDGGSIRLPSPVFLPGEFYGQRKLQSVLQTGVLRSIALQRVGHN